MKVRIKYALILFIFVLLSINLSGNPAPNDSTEINQNWSSIGIIDIFFLFIGLFIGGVSIYWYSRNKIYSILSKERDLYIDQFVDSGKKYLFNYIGIVLILKERKDNKQKTIDELKNVISSSNTALDKEKKILASLNETSNDKEDNKITEEEIIKSTVEWNVNPDSFSTKTIYFTIPEADGSFKTLNGKNAKEVDCFYKIEKEDNNQKGKLYFISGAFDLRALDNIDYYLNPVCEIENISDRTHAKRISQVNYGNVILNGDKWTIDSNNKVKIRLI